MSFALLLAQIAVAAPLGSPAESPTPAPLADIPHQFIPWAIGTIALVVPT